MVSVRAGVVPPSGLVVINVSAYGAKGDGVNDDTQSITQAISASPQTGATIGCTIFFPPGHYKTTSALTNGTNTLFKSVTLWGAGSCGTNQCTVEIQTNGAYYGYVIGTGNLPNTSGFQSFNIGFRDMTETGLGGLEIKASPDGLIQGTSCFTRGRNQWSGPTPADLRCLPVERVNLLVADIAQ